MAFFYIKDEAIPHSERYFDRKSSYFQLVMYDWQIVFSDSTQKVLSSHNPLEAIMLSQEGELNLYFVSFETCFIGYR